MADETPMGDFDDVSNSMFIPSAADCDAVENELIVLVAKVLVQYVPCLRIFQDYVPSHIPHKYSTEMSKPSEIVCADYIRIIIVALIICIYYIRRCH